MANERDYPIGYGRPPRATRFRKGHSGNPQGRPPNARHGWTLLERALSEPVVVNDNGQRKTITKAEAMYTQLVNKGASGDARSIQLLLGEIRSLKAGLEAASAAGAPGDEVDEQMLMLERLTVTERLELRRLIAKAQGEPEAGEADELDVTAPPATANRSSSSNE